MQPFEQPPGRQRGRNDEWSSSPSIVPHGIALNRAEVDVDQLGAPYRRAAFQAGIDAEIRVCPCREIRHIPSRLLLVRARFVIGGQRRRWRSSEEERVARELEREGHQVTFVDLAAFQPRAHS